MTKYIKQASSQARCSICGASNESKTYSGLKGIVRAAMKEIMAEGWIIDKDRNICPNCRKIREEKNDKRTKKIGSQSGGFMNEMDLRIRRLFRAGFENSSNRYTTIATIEIIVATVPYHNYETWGQGYRVSSEGISVVSEYLDDALELWEKKRGGKG